VPWARVRSLGPFPRAESCWQRQTDDSCHSDRAHR
jgi:hypothetical protein